MNVQLLIDAVVRRTTVLIAQLATAGGVRAPLAHIANQVFADLSAELEAQGVSRKVSADMFGMALRAYQKKIQRLRESSSMRGQSLWSAVLGHVEAGGVLTRKEVLHRFRHDDSSLVRGVLHDLVESGLVSSSGAANHAVFRKTSDEERSVLSRNGSGLDELVWLMVYRDGPLSEEALQAQTGLNATECSKVLRALASDGRIQSDGERWSASAFSLPMGSEAGWEAAVLDHYHAVVKTLCARLGAGADTPHFDAATGGSTYTMDVWNEHPLKEEVLGTLKRVREQLGELRTRVVAYNTDHAVPARYQSVLFYAGQCATEEALDESENEKDLS